MKKVLTFSLAFVVLCFLTSICYSQQGSVEPVKTSLIEESDNGTIDWSSGIIKVTGGASSPNKPMTKAQKKKMAMQGARMDAQRKLAEIVVGVRVSAKSVMKDFVVESDEVRTRVDAIVKGARQVGETRITEEDDGSLYVEEDYAINLYGKDGLIEVLGARKGSGSDDDVTVDPKDVQTVQQKGYTGIIFRTKEGETISPSLAPNIYDENGNLLFTLPQLLTQMSNVGFYKKEVGQTGEGSNPLVIDVIKIVNGTDVQISSKELLKVLGIQAQVPQGKEGAVISKILKAANVVKKIAFLLI